MEYKTILSAYLLLAISEVIGPISRYLLSKVLTFLTALNMVDRERKDLEIIFFESFKENASWFVSKIQGLLKTTSLDFEIS